MDFFKNLWDRPFHMLIVVCVLLSIITMVMNFIRNQLRERKSSEPIKQVAEALENKNN